MDKSLPLFFKSSTLFSSLIFTVILGLGIHGVSSTVHAATLTLTKIGAMDLGGKVYKDWWYTGTNVTLYGMAAASSDVVVKVDEAESTVKSDASGAWQALTSTPSGDHPIVITSGGESIAFTLHAGQGLPANSGTSGATTTGQKGETTTEEKPVVPITGVGTNIFYAILALGLIGTGSVLWIKKTSA